MFLLKFSIGLDLNKKNLDIKQSSSLTILKQDAPATHSNKMSEPQGLTRKYIPNDVWQWISKRTSFGTSIFECIRGAVKYPQGPGVGLVAPG